MITGMYGRSVRRAGNELELGNEAEREREASFINFRSNDQLMSLKSSLSRNNGSLLS